MSGVKILSFALATTFAELHPCIREEAEHRGFSWGFFNFTVKFSLYNQDRKTWYQDLLEALIPAGKGVAADTGARRAQ
jgi:hypothetical protein